MLFSLSSVGIGLVLSRAGGAFPFADALAAMRRIRPLMGLADLVFIGAIAATAAGVAGSQ